MGMPRNQICLNSEDLDDHHDQQPALEDWAKLLSDVPTARAILDRFLHHAITIAIAGRSYRIKDSLPPVTETKKTRKPNEPPTAGAAS
jgi:IstB-like ATP binding protein